MNTKKSVLSVQEFMNLSKQEQNETLRKLLIAKPIDKKLSNYCEFLDINVCTPCMFDKCPYHCDNESSVNCMKIYRNNNKSNLNMHQLAVITNLGEHTIRLQAKQIFGKIRRNIIKQDIEVSEVNRFTMIRNAKVCVNCGKLIDKSTTNPQLVYDGYEWCSRECKNEKPEWVIDNINFFKADILSCLKIAYSRFKKLSDLCFIFNTTKRNLLLYYNKYFGIPVTSFGVEAIDSVDWLRSSGSFLDLYPINYYSKIQDKKIINYLNKVIKTLDSI